MNKKGFVVSAVLYPLLVIFLALIMGLLSMSDVRKRILDRMKLEISDSIFDEANCSCDTILNKLNYIIKNGVGGGGGGSGSSISLSVKAYETNANIPLTGNTDNDIAILPFVDYNDKYVLSSTEPTLKQEGMIWLKVATSATYGYKTDTVYVPIFTAYQYTGEDSGWTIVSAMIYQNSEWKTISTGTQYFLDSGIYSSGQEIKYGDLDWKVIDSDEESVTLILKGNYTTGAFATSGSTEFEGSSSFATLNQTFVNDNEFLKQAVAYNFLIKQGTYQNSDYFVRYPHKTELSTDIPNSSNTPFWTDTINEDKLYFADKNGLEGKIYSVSASTFYRGMTVYGGCASLAVSLNTNLSNSTALLNSTTEKVNSSYTSASAGYAGDSCPCSYGNNGSICNSTGWSGGGSGASDWCYPRGGGNCVNRTVYTLVSENLGIRPVITVKKG